MRKRMVVGAAAVCFTLAATSGARNVSPLQMNVPQPTPQNSSHPTALDGASAGPDVFRDRQEAQAARSRTNERHKRIVTDTEKLLQLSTELKADVDKTTKDELSVQVIQKAAEIEKLAHDVKERMRGQ